MLSQEITDDLEIFTKKIMENEGISQYELNIEGQTKKGDNFCSEIVFYKVTSKICGKKFNFVMKTARRSDVMRKASQDAIADKREMHLYGKVFPALRQLLSEEETDYKLENVPKTYFICTEAKHETAIMENLNACGYRLWDKQKAMNLEHIKTVLKGYGKYHATSMALRVKKPQLFKELTADMGNVYRYFINTENVVKMFKGFVEDALNVLEESGRRDIVEKLKYIPEDVMGVLGRNLDEDDRVVITHGDCWTNNMMFKYQDPESTQPIGLCFLDFQLSSFGTPATDLSYFIYATFDADTLENNFDKLLVLYYDSFASTLRNLGLNPDEVFTFQNLKQHWRKHAIFGLIMGSALIKIQLIKKEKAPEIVDNGKEPDAYKRRIIGIYENYVKTCLN